MKKYFAIATLALSFESAFALPFSELVQSGSLAQVRAAIEAGAKVNDSAPPINDSMLVFAVRNNDPQVMAALLKAGAEPEWKGLPGKPPLRTPIEAAAESSDPEYLKLLVAAGAKIEFQDLQGFTAIDHAAGNRNPEIAAILIKAGARASPHPTAAQAVPIQPLCLAVALNPNIDVSKLFLANGGDPNAIGVVGLQLGTPLHFALDRNRSAEVFALLIRAGADLNSSQKCALGVNIPPMFELAGTDRVDIVPLYAKAGADPNAKLPPTMGTPLMTAAVHSREPTMIQALLAIGARVDDRDLNGNTALILVACYGKEPRIIDALLAGGADPNAKNNDHKSAYDYALGNEALKDSAELASLHTEGAVSLILLAKDGSADAVKAAIRGGSKVNESDLNGLTPLTVAAQYNRDPEVPAALIAGGADPNRPNGLGRTPLMLAAESNPNAIVISALLKGGADPKARTLDMFKLTALMIAAQSASDPAIVAALASGGSEIDATDSLGRTALIIAADLNGNPRVLGALLEAGARAGSKDMTQRRALDYAMANPAFKGSPQLAALAAASK